MFILSRPILSVDDSLPEGLLSLRGGPPLHDPEDGGAVLGNLGPGEPPGLCQPLDCGQGANCSPVAVAGLLQQLAKHSLVKDLYCHYSDYY